MNASTIYKIRVSIEPREDDGLRVWSEDLPELVLSHSDAALVIADIPRAMEVILSVRFGAPVRVEELKALPPANGRSTAPDRPLAPAHREFAARAA